MSPNSAINVQSRNPSADTTFWPMTYLVFSGPVDLIKEALVQRGRQVQGHVYEPLTDNEPSPPLLSLQNGPQLLRCVLVLFTPRPQELDNLPYRLGILQPRKGMERSVVVLDSRKLCRFIQYENVEQRGYISRCRLATKSATWRNKSQ
jgi:hypothetical protein